MFYSMAGKSRVLYTGITNNPGRRTWEPKNDELPGFTSGYKVRRLVHFEAFKYVGNAIARAKKNKGWLRKNKIAWIESVNPTWEDLSEGWFKSRSFASLRMTNQFRISDRR
jgi:putative endonuclease